MYFLVPGYGEKVGGEEGWEGWEEVTRNDVDGWLGEISEKGWNTMDWLTNIEEGSGVSGTVEVKEGDEEEERESVERASKRVRRAGLGTMIQPKFDYLSEEKRDDYAVWKEAMLVKIDDLVARGIMSEDVDTTEG